MNEPQKLEDYPDYTEAVNRKRALEIELNEVGKKIVDVLRGLAKPADGITAEAEALLAGKDVSRAGEEAMREQLTALRHHQKVLAAAVQLQHRCVKEMRAAASKEICKTHGPAFGKRAARIGWLCRELATLGQQQHDCLEDFERQRISIVEPYMSRQTTLLDETIWQLRRVADEVDGLVRTC